MCKLKFMLFPIMILLNAWLVIALQDCPGVVAEKNRTPMKCKKFALFPREFCDATLGSKYFSPPSGASYTSSVTFGQLCPLSMKNTCGMIFDPVCDEALPPLEVPVPPPGGGDCQGIVMSNGITTFTCKDLQYITATWCTSSLQSKGMKVLPGASYSDAVTFPQVCPETLKETCKGVMRAAACATNPGGRIIFGDPADCLGVVLISGAQKFTCEDMAFIPSTYCDAMISKKGMKAPHDVPYSSTAKFGQICPITLSRVCTHAESIKFPLCSIDDGNIGRQDQECRVKAPDDGNIGNCPEVLAHGASCKPGCNKAFAGEGHFKCKNGLLNDFTCSYTGIDCPGTALIVDGSKFECRHLKFITKDYCNSTLRRKGAVAPSFASYDSDALFCQVCPIELWKLCYRSVQPKCDISMAGSSNGATIVIVVLLLICIGASCLMHFKKIPTPKIVSEICDKISDKLPFHSIQFSTQEDITDEED